MGSIPTAGSKLSTVSDEAIYRQAELAYWSSLGVEPREEWHELPSTSAPMRVQVVGDGPPVLFLHGVNTSGTVWAPLATRLQEFRCLLVDRPGCGLSGPFRAAVDDVAAFKDLARRLPVEMLDALGIDRAPLVSTSLGGYFALHSAAAHPDRVSGVVQLGWTVGALNRSLPLVMRLGGARRLGKLMARMPVPKRAVRPMLARIGLRQALQGGRVSDEMLEWFGALLSRTPTMRNELDGSPSIIGPLRGLNEAVLFTDEELAGITVPTTFLWGDGDPFGDPAVAGAFAGRLPGSTLRIVPNAGHAPWIDDPEHLAAATIDRLRRPSAP